MQAGFAVRGRLDEITPDIPLNLYCITFIDKSSQKEGKGKNLFALAQIILGAVIMYLL